jgi:NADPH:quinone reductase-like Zn-dependent oxidoreductase
MRAVVTENYGAAPTLIELPTPSAGPGEIRVKISHASLNGFDNALAAGYLQGLMEHAFPVVLGRDYAGAVDQVGEGVTGYAVGDRVFGVVLTQPLHAGSFAEYVVIPEDHNVAPVPDGVELSTAGVLGLAGASALACLDAVKLGPADTVLVSGATGGVGAATLQLAGSSGATVIATAAGAAAIDHVSALGADYVVDHTGDLAEQVRALAPGGLSVVLHYAGDPVGLADLLGTGGRFASLLSVGPEQLGDREITTIPVYATPHRAVLDVLADHVARGRLRMPVQHTYGLADVPQAFVDFNTGKLGKLAVTTD